MNAALLLLPMLSGNSEARGDDSVISYACAKAIASSVIDLEGKGFHLDYVKAGVAYCNENSDGLEVVFMMKNRRVRGGAYYYYLDATGSIVTNIRVGR
ncbi:MAG TPA: hypothetical protein VMR06_13725 [Dokdonella sp.]|uniref:hypothetical protein n=1 Tax=Dokdonella sp. TaxID=2291710 RepID=UPI002BC14B6F|nr:hypothetical protein [Dokdonella sp.]HUD43045.1 hypothetical protein [Dokdonella sp.]